MPCISHHRSALPILPLTRGNARARREW
jgi:hypothetical protein